MKEKKERENRHQAAERYEEVGKDGGNEGEDKVKGGRASPFL